ncbi:MAG: 3-keto-disaccharide hydrolase, partial [Planctomycetia bacterium]
MRNWFAAAAVILTTASWSAAADNTLTPEEIADGWILLFDGETKFGWKAEEPKLEDTWYAKDGVLTSDEQGPFNHLKSNAVFADFVLKIDFRVNKKGNSGVFFRGATTGPKFVADKVHGYEAQIDDNDPRGLLYQTGGLYDVAPARKLVKGESEWRSYEVAAEGDH